MFELRITQTAKGFDPKDRWQTFNKERHDFDSMEGVYKYLKETYGKSKRWPMYIDQKDGPSIKCGWVIGQRHLSHTQGQSYIQQDWVQLVKYTTVNLDEVKP